MSEDSDDPPIYTQTQLEESLQRLTTQSKTILVEEFHKIYGTLAKALAAQANDIAANTEYDRGQVAGLRRAAQYITDLSAELRTYPN